MHGGRISSQDRTWRWSKRNPSWPVEDKADIEKFKDYKPDTSSDGEAPEAPPAPTPTPPKEVVEKPVSTPEPKAVKQSSSGSETADRVFARKLAEDNNVSLSSIKGTGPDGSIVKADIEEYLASGKKEAPAKASKADKSTVSAINYTDTPHAQIRKVTASRLLLAKQTIPHYYLTIDTCVDKLTKMFYELQNMRES